MSDTRNVGCRLKSVCKSYSGDLTESRVRLLRAGCRNLCANASFLRCSLIDISVVQRVEALLKNGSFRLISLVLTTLSDELVKGWHSSFLPPSCKFNVYIQTRSYCRRNCPVCPPTYRQTVTVYYIIYPYFCQEALFLTQNFCVLHKLQIFFTIHLRLFTIFHPKIRNAKARLRRKCARAERILEIILLYSPKLR